MSNDHLAGKTGNVDDLLRALTDAELDEQITHWQDQKSATADGRGSWGYSKLISAASRIKQERHGSAVPPGTDSG
jgi:hypothetical protein